MEGISDGKHHGKIIIDYRSLYEGANDAIFIMSDDMFIECNQRTLDLFGYKDKNEIIGKVPYAQQFSPERQPDGTLSKKKALEKVKRALKGKSQVFEWLHKKRDGALFLTEVSLSRLVPQNGKPLIQAIIRDITERKRVQEELAASEKKFRQLTEEINDWVWEVDAQGRYTYASPNIKDLLGYEQKDVIGKTPFDLMPPAQANEMRRLFKNIVAKKDPFKHLENDVIHKKGHVLLLETNGTPIFDKKGELIGYRGVDRDITERRASEERLKKSLRLADDLMRTIPSGIYIYAYKKPNKLILLDANKEAERLAGRTIDDWKGKEFNEIWPEAKKLGITDDYLGVAKTGKTHESEDTLYVDDRLKGIFRVRAFSLPDSKIAVAFENITKARRAQQELIATKNQLQRIVNSAKELIVAVDKDGVITTWNATAAAKTGHAEHEMIGTNTFLDELPSGLSSLFELISATLNKKKGFIQEHSIKDLHNNRIILRSSTSLIQHAEGAVIISNDITNERSVYRRLEQGHCYFSTKETLDELIDQCRVFTDQGYELLYTSRDDERPRQKQFHQLLLTHEEHQNACSTLKELERHVKKFFNKKSRAVIILSRMDYFSLNEGFMEMAKFLLWFHDHIKKYDCIAIIHKGYTHKDEKAFFKEECDEYPESEGSTFVLDQRKIAVLRFIEERNELDTLVNYTAITKHFNIARMTARMWLHELQQLNLIVVKQQGKVKSITLTAKGKEFSRKQPTN